MKCDVDLIYDEIFAEVIKLAPRLPTEDERHEIENRIVNSYGYFIERTGRDTEGKRIIYLQKPDREGIQLRMLAEVSQDGRG